MTTITIDRAVVEQALEALTVAWQQNPRWQITEGMHALRAALAQQAWVCPESPEHRYAKPGHCEDCGRTLVLAQQAEPAKTFLITGNEFCGAPPAPYATWGDALAGMLDAGKIDGLRISALAQQAYTDDLNQRIKERP